MVTDMTAPAEVAKPFVPRFPMPFPYDEDSPDED